MVIGRFNCGVWICRVVHNPLNLYGDVQMDRKKLADAVLERAHESDGKKKLNCAEAFELAKELGVEIAEIGRTCNRRNERICKCQLGCLA